MVGLTTPTFDYKGWHLGGGAGGLNLGDVWQDYTGAGIRVAVYDQGIDSSHSDLIGNLDVAASINGQTGQAGIPTLGSQDNHGTAVAGIIAAARDEQGTVGIAYDATLLSIYDPLTSLSMPLSVARAYLHAGDHADVLNNSWGFGNLFKTSPNSAFADANMYQSAAAAIAYAADEGRDGLGTVIVQSAGNSRGYGDNTNLHKFQNNQYTITVAATGMDGHVSSYSTGGATVLVSAAGGDSRDSSQITTTDRTGSAGYVSADYTMSFSGTSAAAPMVSGIVALMLDANPLLGYRDVQEILAYSARNSDTGHAGWQVNGANNANGGGLHVSDTYGFGLVDAHAAVRLAESWTAQSTFGNRYVVTLSDSGSALISENNASGALRSLHVGTPMRIDRVEVDLDISHTHIGDLRVELTSPDGTRSLLLDRAGVGSLSATGSSQDNIGFTFGSVQYWGETGAGTWSLRVIDAGTGNTVGGVLNSWTLRLIGDAYTADDQYVYTNEFATLGDAARGTLSDLNGGSDMINGAALTAAAVIDLSGGMSSIAGRNLAIDGSIEHAQSGDGDDTLIGNAGGNILRGNRGNDTLVGGGGNDTLDGGVGFDTASYANETSAILADLQAGTVSTGGGAVDQLIGIEQVTGSAFADILRGGNGNDSFVGGAEADQFDGRGGSDTVSYAGNIVGVQVDLAANTAVGGDATGDSFAGIENLTGSAFADILTGDAGDNVLTGGLGRDELYGGAGFDYASYASATAGVTMSLYPGTTYSSDNREGGALGDILYDIEGLIGSNYDDILKGTNGNNRLFGGGGMDTLIGFGGDDYMDGGAGQDDYVVDSLSDIVIDSGSDDPVIYRDRVKAWVDGYTLHATIESLILVSATAISGYGNDNNNQLWGNYGNNYLYGGGGVDVIDGAEGADTMEGGTGNDVYYVDDAADVVIEAAGGGDYDKVSSSVTYMLPDHVEELYLTGSAAIDGYGNAQNNRMKGTGGDNRLFAGAGDDWIDSSYGSDLLDGGEGSDSYFLTQDGFNDTISDSGTTGVDVVYTNFNNYHLVDSAEVLVLYSGSALTGYGNAFDNIIRSADVSGNIAQSMYGLDGNDTLIGNGGGDYLDGGAGSDTIAFDDSAGAVTINLETGTGSGSHAQGDVYVSIENVVGTYYGDTLIGNAAANILDGGDDASLGFNDILDGRAGDDTLLGRDGNDSLTGGSGNDRLEGGAGNDTYLFAGGFGSDLLIETGGGDKISFGADLLVASMQVLRQDNNLWLGFGSGSDSITFVDWFANAACRVETFTFNDGLTLGASQVEAMQGGSSSFQLTICTIPGLGGGAMSDQLISSMAAFDVPGGGETVPSLATEELMTWPQLAV